MRLFNVSYILKESSIKKLVNKVIFAKNEDKAIKSISNESDFVEVVYCLEDFEN